MSSYYFSPIGNSQQLATSGAPLNGGTITTFQAGTNTPQATYVDNAGGSPSTSLTLNTYGLPSSPVWLLGGQAYKFVIKDSLGNLIRTLDNVSGIDDAIAIAADQKARIPAFGVYQSALQTLPSASITKVLLQTKEFDTANAFDAATNYRFQPTVAGYYQLSAAVTLSSSAALSFASIYKNGVEFKRGDQSGSAAGSGAVFTVSSLVLLNGSSDYVELFCGQNSGGSLNTGAGQVATYFNGFLARAL